MSTKPIDITLSPIQRFWRLLRVDKREIGHVYTYAIFNGLINLSLPLGIQAIIGLIQGGEVSASWVVLVSFVIIGIAVTGMLQMMQLKITENLQRKIFTRASFEFAYRIPRIKHEALDKHYAPELVNRFFDTLSVQKGLSKILMDFSTATLQVVFGLILLSLYHPFFILFGLTLVLLIYMIFRFTSKRGLNASIEESKNKYEVAHWLEEVARTMDTFKLAGRTDLPLQKADRYVSKYLDSRQTHFKVLFSQYGFLVAFKVIVAAGLLLAGGLLVFEQQMNIGQFVAAEIVILMIMTSVEKLILSLDTIYDVLTSLEKMGQVTDLPLEQNTGSDLEVECTNEKLSIEMENVMYTYPGLETPTINGLSFKIQQGDKIYITGENSSGKTTLLHLIAGLFQPQKGNINYNGMLARSIRPESIRTVMGDFMSQEVIFNGTITENIGMGKANVSMKDIRWAVEKIGLESFIRNLPNGYDTELLPEGKHLPRSIIQKILLARSIADRPKLLLIEDMLDAIPQDEKKGIIKFLTSEETSWALIVTSQSEHWANYCHKTMVLQEGKIVFSGNSTQFEEHVRKGGNHA